MSTKSLVLASNNKGKLREFQTMFAELGVQVVNQGALGVESCPEPLIAVGHWYGEICAKPAGDGGFGYDPHFYLPDFGKTAAELTAEEKNRVSHRGRALVAMVRLLKENWGW